MKYQYLFYILSTFLFLLCIILPDNCIALISHDETNETTELSDPLSSINNDILHELNPNKLLNEEQEDEEEEDHVLSSHITDSQSALHDSLMPQYQPLSVKERFLLTLGDGRFEFACLLCLIAIAIQMYRGYRYNIYFVNVWVDTTANFFQNTFTTYGFESSSFKQYGWDMFEYFATGHPNCDYFLVKINCYPRQCLWRYLLGFILGHEDYMEIEAGISMPERCSLIIGQRIKLKALQHLYNDLGQVTSVKKHSLLKSSITTLADNPECIDKLLTPDICNIINHYQPYLSHLIISDMIPSERFKSGNKILRFRMKLPPVYHMSHAVDFLQVLLRLIDAIAKLKLSDSAKDTVKKTREIVEQKKLLEAEEERKEILEKKKAEKREEEDERLKAMTPQMRQKWEEKQQKKEAKNRMHKIKTQEHLNSFNPMQSCLPSSICNDVDLGPSSNSSTVLPNKLFENSIKEQLHPLPLSIVSICPEEAAWFQRLETIQASVDEAVFKQQLLISEAYEGFLSCLDEGNQKMIPRGTTIQTLRIHIYNTHHNQSSRHLELDSYSTMDLTDVPPPRWILRLQGRILSPSQLMTGNNLQQRMIPRMTSFFEKIIISRTNETIIWDRHSQTPQPILEVPIKTCYAKHVAQQETKLIKLGICDHSTDHLSRSQNMMNSQYKSQMLTLIDATASELVTRHLVDSDGIEFPREGDTEEDILITFFPAYRSPHFKLSSDLELIVGSSIGSLNQIIRAIWSRSRSLSNGKQHTVPNLKEMPCDDALRQLFQLNNKTFNFHDLPTLLIPHLSPAGPITIKHRIKLIGDYIDNETIYDFQVDMLETLFPLSPHLAPWLMTKHHSNQTIPPTPEFKDTTRPTSDDVEHVIHSPMSTPHSVSNDVQINQTIQDIWNDLLDAVSRRNLLIEFSKHPMNTFNSLLTTTHIEESDYRHPLLDENFLKEYELADMTSDFYAQPWTLLAAEAYLSSRRKNFDDLIGRTLSTANVERRLFTIPDISDTVVPLFQQQSQETRRQSRSISQSEQHQIPHTRIPVFTQMSRQSLPSNVYNYPPCQVGRYLIPSQSYHPYLQQYGMHWQLQQQQQQQQPLLNHTGVSQSNTAHSINPSSLIVGSSGSSQVDWTSNTTSIPTNLPTLNGLMQSSSASIQQQRYPL